jgi:integrase/recombinase XerC
VRACGRQLGVKLTPHCLRHTFCTLLLKHGANLKVIAELAGHARLSTTARYTRVDIRELARIYRIAHPRCAQ